MISRSVSSCSVMWLLFERNGLLSCGTLQWKWSLWHDQPRSRSVCVEHMGNGIPSWELALGMPWPGWQGWEMTALGGGLA